MSSLFFLWQANGQIKSRFCRPNYGIPIPGIGLGSITPPKVGSTLSLAFSPDGKYLAGGNDDMTARIWDAKSGKEIHVFKGHWGNVMAVAFSPDSKTLATGGDFSIKFWDMATGQNIGTITPKVS